MSRHRIPPDPPGNTTSAIYSLLVPHPPRRANDGDGDRDRSDLPEGNPTMKNDANAHADARTLGELIDDIEIAMLTSTAADGSLVSRPLATLQTDFHGDLWFFTSLDSGKVDDIMRNPRINVAYADPDDHVYVSVVGTASIERDRARIEELWHPRARTFFPEGKDDPHLVLLKVEVDSAEFWRNTSGLVHQALQLMHAVTGGGPQDLGENRVLNLKD